MIYFFNKQRNSISIYQKMNSSPSHKIFKPYQSIVFNGSPLNHKIQSKCNICIKQNNVLLPKPIHNPQSIPKSIPLLTSPHTPNSMIKKQITNPIIRIESDKNFSVKRRNSEMAEINSKSNLYIERQKKMKGKGSQFKQMLYQTSATMKDIENCGKNLSNYSSKKNRASVQQIIFQDKKIDGSCLDIIKPLGKGKYGTVFLVRQKYTGFIMALKVIEKKRLRQPNLLEQFIRELKIQFYLDHPGIIKLYGFFDDAENFYQMMELGCDGQLYDKIKDNTFNQESSSYIARSLLNVIQYMHGQKVLHRDIKPENIVIVLGNLKICDFGWAVYNNTEMRSTFCGTPLYFSPQLLSGQQYDEKVDLWAIGIMIFQLMYGTSPFGLKRPQDLAKIVTHEIEYPKNIPVSSEFKQFTSMILQKNPYKRPTSKQLLETNFIKHYAGLQVCEQLCRNDEIKNQSKNKIFFEKINQKNDKGDFKNPKKI